MKYAWPIALLCFAMGSFPGLCAAGLSAGNTFEFDGAGDVFVVIAPGDEFAPAAFTIEAWVNPSSVTGRHAVYATNDPSVDGIGIYIEDGNAVVEISGEVSTANAGFVTGEWQHLAVALSSGFMRIYRNNALAGIRTTFAPAPVSTAFAFVGGDAAGDYFAGRIDELRVWSTYHDGIVLEDTRYHTLPASTVSLEVYFRFDETSGTTLTDAAPPGGNDVAQLTGTESWLDSTAPLTDLSTHATNTFVMWSQVPSSAAQLVKTGLIVEDIAFLAEEGDDVASGHNGATYGLVTTDVPAAVGGRWARVYELATSDVGNDGGSVRLTFDDSEAGGAGALDATHLYHLLRRPAGSAGDFVVMDTTAPFDVDRVFFDLDVTDIGTGNEFTLGVMAEASIGLYFDGSYTQTELVDQLLFTPFDAWVVAKDVRGDMAGDGLARWEALVDFPPEIAVLSATLIPPTAVNTGDPGDAEWIVDTQTCLEPDGNGDIALLQYSLQLVDRPTAVTTLSFAASNPSSFTPPAPGWSDCDGTPAFFTTLVESTLRFPSPNVELVADVPGDQGGWVRVTIDRSTLDDATASTPISGYNVWREVTAPKTAAGSPLALNDASTDVGLAQLVAWGARVIDGAIVVTGDAMHKGPNSIPPGTWEIVASFFAAQQTQYTVVASTAADAMPTSFFVSAHTLTPSVWYGSEPGSGTSIDNIAPGVPQNVVADYAAAGVDLAWDPSPENDFQFYRVYRGTEPEFALGAGQVVQETTASAWTDATATPWGYYYKITALDHAGNESDAGVPGTVTGNEPTPRHYALAEPVPNPFNPQTTISFTLKEPGPVRLDVYDIIGRRVSTLLQGILPAGTHEARWNGTDGDGHVVASGMYLFRIQSRGFVATRSATLLK